MKHSTRFIFAASMLAMVAVTTKAADKVVNTLDVGDGQTADVLSGYGIETSPRANPATDPVKVIVRPGGDAIFWARTRITLRDGFKATAGTTTVMINGTPTQVPTGLLLAVDSDLDGYSDMEEITDSDGDGIFDAWELHNGLNMGVAGDASLDYDFDGASNLSEFLNGRDPLDRADSGLMPSGAALVLRIGPKIGPPSPAYYSVNTSTWVILTADAP